ncbi:MAG: S41 family peptidase [Bacteroidia bacterium]|nr:S41 family peptidase [Bacteroidia bacterium]
MKKIFATVFVALVAASSLSGQSKNFKLGQWVEIQNSILKELNRTYVDSLPLDRIQRVAIDAMLEDLDPYTIYIPEEDQEDLEMLLNKSYGGFGAVIYKPDTESNVTITEPYRNSPADKLGFRCGDEITAIDGVSVQGLTASECTAKMKGKPGTSVVFTVKKVYTGEVKDVTVVRERIKLPDVEYVGMLDETTGYILQSGFTEGVSTDIKNAVQKLKGQGMKKLVLDLRSNGGGLLQEAVKIVSLFVPKGSVVVTAKGNSEDTFAEYKTTSEPVDTELPIVVMVNSGSASSSEIVTGALQDLDRATVMGERSYGKGLVQSIRPLPYNGQLKVTTAKYYTPSGRCVQAIDYSHRNEDGSVGHIPDSLTHEFKTLHGRTVRDGGGITPDVEIPYKDYSRLTYSVVLGGIVEQYALDYVRKHESIPAVDDFHFTDAEYSEFVAFAKEKEFDYRSSAKTYFDNMKKELEKDGLAEGMTEQIQALEKAIDMDKETYLNLKKDELIPFIEEEIVVRYYFQEAGVKIRLRYDDQLKEALTKPLISVD